jgi:hypothetical protein
VAFQGQDRGSRARTEPDRGSRHRGRTSNRPGASRGPFETLESRVLLSSFETIPNLSTYASRGVVPSPILIVHLVPHPSGEASQAGPAADLFGQAEIRLAPLNTLAVDSPDSKEVSGAESVGGESSVPIMTLAGFSTASLDEDALPPLIVVAAPGSSPSSWSGTPPDSVSVGANAEPALFPIDGGESVSSQAVAASSVEESVVPALPGARHVELESTMNSLQGSISVVDIPVDPATEALGLSLHSMPGDGEGPAPVVDGIVLVDRDGDPVAQLGPLWGSQAPPPVRNVTVSLDNAPAGGNLLVQISVPSSGSSSATGTVSASGSQLPYLMDIQRQEMGSTPAITAAAALAGPVPSLVRSGIGALTTSSMSGQGGDSSPSTDSSLTMAAGVELNAPAIVVDQGEVITPDMESVADPAGSFNVRVSSGPLASRSASPLGPALATVLADPAPPVDRHERALSQSIDESESDQESEVRRRGLEYAQIEGALSPSPTGFTSRSRTGDTGVALAGLGAFPLKVTDLHGPGDRAELESLLATLPGSLNQEDPATIVAAQDFQEDDISALLASSGRSARADRVAPDYLTTACGLVLGLSLTGGPLFPDILSMISSGSSRWRRGVPSGAAGRGRCSTPGPAGGIGNWLQSPLSSRLRRASR